MIPQLPGLVRFLNDPCLDGAEDRAAGERERLYYTADGKAWPILCRSHLAIYENETRVRAISLIPQRFPRVLRPFVRSVVRKVHRWAAHSTAKDPFFVHSVPAAPMHTLVAVENLSPQVFSDSIVGWEKNSNPSGASKVTDAQDRTIVLIVRDPWNHLASLLKSPQLGPPHPLRCEDFQDRWLEYAREYTGETRHLKAMGHVVRFNYAAWFSDVDYRRQLSAELGCAHSDFGLNTVSDFGGGSSFDGRKFHQQAQSMGVRERWRAYADHPLMRRLCDDEEVRALSSMIFGIEPPLPRSVPVRGRVVPFFQPRAA